MGDYSEADILASISEPDIEWFVVPDFSKAPTVSIVVDSFADIVSINGKEYTDSAMQKIVSDFNLPTDIALDLISRCTIAYNCVEEYLDYPDFMEPIDHIKIMGKIIEVFSDEALAQEPMPTEPDAYSFVVTDIFIDSNPNSPVDLSAVRDHVCDPLGLDFMPVMFAGTRKEAINYVQEKHKNALIIPSIPQFHYKTKERIILRGVAPDV